MGVKTSGWNLDEEQDVYRVYSHNTYYKEKKNNFTVKKHGRYHLHQVTTSDWTIETVHH